MDSRAGSTLAVRNSTAANSYACIFIWMYVFLALALSLGVLEKNLIPFICELCERSSWGPSPEMGRAACCSASSSVTICGPCQLLCEGQPHPGDQRGRGLGFKRSSASLSWAELLLPGLPTVISRPLSPSQTEPLSPVNSACPAPPLPSQLTYIESQGFSPVVSDLFSLCIMSSRFIHVVACVRISFLFKAE